MAEIKSGEHIPKKHNLNLSPARLDLWNSHSFLIKNSKEPTLVLSAFSELIFSLHFLDQLREYLFATFIRQSLLLSAILNIWIMITMNQL